METIERIKKWLGAGSVKEIAIAVAISALSGVALFITLSN